MSTFRIHPRRVVPRRRSASVRPTVEAMEARQLLATFFVTNNLDSGPGSFRQAIVDANATPNFGSSLDAIQFSISLVQNQFLVGGNPTEITVGPDGNLYFTDRNPLAPRVARLATDGSVTSFPLAPGSLPTGITPGPLGSLWVTDPNPARPRIVQLSPAGVVLNEFLLAMNSQPNQITVGPDGNLWFTDNGAIANVTRLTPAGALTSFSPLAAGGNPGGITAGPDGNLWFTNSGFIGRVSPNGALTFFPIAGNTVDITVGPDGNLWFTDNGPVPRVGRITPTGGTTFFNLLTGDIPADITAGPDGNLYFTIGGANRRIGRISTAGAITEATYPGGGTPLGIVAGPDGNFYFTEPATGQIGQLNTAAAVLTPASPLPAITDPVNIDAYSRQPGARANEAQGNFSEADVAETDVAVLPVRIDGINAGPGANGLTIVAPNCIVGGLSITRFAGAGIAIEGVRAVGNVVFGNFLGVAAFNPFGTNVLDLGANPLGNGLGIRVTGSNNRIGGTIPVSRNVIQGNRDAGVEVAGPAGTGNLIETNFILDNGRFDVTGDGQPDLDTTNPSAGVRITTSNNFVGEAVGAALAGGGNIISGNLRGVYIAGAAAQGNILLNNEIGTDVGIAGATPPVRGTSPRRNAAFAGNLLDGVLIQDATLNVVGGAIANARNVIAASGVDGVSIQGRDASGNRVLGNFIGFNFRNGIIYFMPNRDGVNVTSANNAIGGPTEAARNFIIENRRNGITIIGPTATGNQVQGNFIGTFQGGEDVGNTFEGVLIQDATDNVVGGTAAGVRNVISGNNNGVVIRGPRASGNRVQGNFIGTASDGATDLGNAVEGVLIDDAPRNTIGGTTAEARNIISGNNRGVRLAGAGASGNLVQGNFIGTDVTGTRPLGNSLDGVLVAAGASGNAIGGVDPAAGNTIAFNGGIGNVVTAGLGNGVLIESGTGNPILSNRIFTNNLLGIDLGGDGVTPNDPRDGDGGPNNLQNAPVLTGASTSSVRGVLNSTPNTTFLIQFFGNAQTDPSGLGEGQAPIGSTAVTTDAAGNATFAVTLAAPLAEGQFVTATATSTATNDTSEFSNAISNAPAILQFSGAPFFVDEGASTATITVTRTGNTGGTVSVAFATGDGTAIAGADYLSTAGTLTFNPGVTNLTFTIPIVQDALIEPNETVNLSLGTTGPPGGALLGPQSTAALTIRDDDGVTVQVAAADVIVGEGDGVASITVTRSNGVGTATVDFVTGDGTATATADYLSVAGTIRFGPGDTAVTITVPIVQDDLRESNETFFVALRNPTGVTLGAGTATVTIVDDDAPGAFQLGQAAYAVLEGQRFATITVTRVGGSGGTITVPFATIDGTAVAGSDYTAAAGVLTFGPGVTTQSFTVPILDDPFVEPDETVLLTLGIPSGGATLGGATAAILTIINDDLDRFGPVVADVQTIPGRRGITGLRLIFNEPLNAARAQDLFNYDLVSEGRDGRFGTFDDARVGLRSATYDPATSSVTLTPAGPLRLGRFYRIRVNPTIIPVSGRNITDVADNVLDGDANGIPGGTYVALIGRGPNLRYFDRDGDELTVQLRRGGTLELRRAPDGEAEQLRILNPRPGRSELTGHLRLPRTGSDGRTTIPVILGSRGVRIRLRTPPFFIGRVSEAAVDSLLAAGGMTA